MTRLKSAFVCLTCVLVLGTAMQSVPGLAGETSSVPQVILVGPSRVVSTIAEASRLARNGAVVEVDAGEYRGDVAVWTQDALTLRAVGGRVKLNAGGNSAEGKAIWVFRGGTIDIEGFEFIEARVPDKNGAGIRLEAGKLTVRNCTFKNNESGILTSGHPLAELNVVNSEFGYNGFGDGQSHNLYAGTIARLHVTGSYFHHAKVGHLLKSRAAVNTIKYNRLTDESGGRASYELEFPVGGTAIVVGNIIEQSSTTENFHLISYGMEGYQWPANALYLVNNTLVDKAPRGGVFLRVRPGAVRVVAVNNLLAGRGGFDSAAPGDYRNNHAVGGDAFEAIAHEDYRLKRGSTLVGKITDPGSADGVSLMPTEQYAHPASTSELVGPPHSPGALQRRDQIR